MKSLLLTGFTAFHTVDENPSEAVVQNIAHLGIADVELTTLILPVSYRGSVDVFNRRYSEIKPDFVLHLGVNQSQQSILLEEYAYNLNSASIADNDGDLREGHVIQHGFEECLSTPFNVDQLCKKVGRFSPSVQMSSDPGRFVCNHIYYNSLSQSISSLFVHVPSEREGVEVSDMTKVIISLIEELVNT